MAGDETPKATDEDLVQSKTVPSGTVEPGAPSGAASEWTASDARGPLYAAGEEPVDHLAHDPAVGHDPATSRDLEPAGGEFDTPVTADAAHGGEAVDEPVPASTDPAPVGVAPSEKRSVWPIAAGIVFGAIIGAGSSIAYYASQSGSSGVDQRIAALSQRVDALQNKPDPQAAIAALQGSVSTIGGKVSALQASVGADTRVDKSNTRADAAEAARPGFDPAPLSQKIQALQANIDTMQKQVASAKSDDAADDKTVAAIGSDIATLKTRDGERGKSMAALGAAIVALKTQDAQQGTTLADLKSQSSTTQGGLDQLRSSQKALEAKISNSPALAVVADSLVTQIDHGGPYAAQVDALSAIGADPAKIAVLKQDADTGVPSAKALAAGFAPLADPIVDGGRHAAAPNAGFLDKLKSGMFSMVSVRAVNDTSGDSLASRVSAIEADLAHDDVTAAYQVWTALPAEAKAKSEAWGAKAKTHVEAMGAARALQSQAIAALGGKKS